ncbi:MAG: pseudouridine synthase, partial [Candidatus Omnitrophota bacterium]
RKVTDLFKKVSARLYPVGRLDKDTTGLILVTNDGDLAHRMAHPGFEVEKEYIAAVEGNVKISDIKKIEKGIELDGKFTAPCRVMLRRKGKKRTVYRVKLREGKKRHIKRMFEAVGGRVAELKRVKYAGLTIGDLKEGEYRALSGREVERLFRLSLPRKRVRE